MDIFQTIAEPARRTIVEYLRDEERSVNDIVTHVGIQQSGVSRHLRILQEAGFVTVRPQGSKRMYSLLPDRFQELERWIVQYRRIWESRLDRFAMALNQQDSKPLDTKKERQL